MPQVTQTVVGRKKEPISEKKASQLSFKSSLKGPISKLTLLAKSLVLAEVS